MKFTRFCRENQTNLKIDLEMGRLNCMAGGKIVDPRLCFCLDVSEMHMFEARMK